MKKTLSGIMLTLLILSMLTIAFNAPFVKAVTDPIVSGTVRDKLGNPIPNVLIVAQDAFTEIDVSSAISNTAGAYTMSVPQGTYNLIVTPPPESGFASTTITNIEVTTDITMDIVLVPAETMTFSGKVVDRDDNPVPNVNVYVYSAAISKSTSTDEQGQFSMRVSPDSYSLQLSGWCAPNVPQNFYLGKITALTITEDTDVTFTLQSRYLSGTVVDPEGNTVTNVAIYVSGGTSFNDFSGWFEAWTTTDSQGNFNTIAFTSPSLSLRATPPPESPCGPVSIAVNVIEDAFVTVTLSQAVTFSGLVMDRGSTPVSNVNVYVYSAAISKSTSTDEQGQFSMRVSPDSYSLQLSGWCAPNVPQNFYLGKITALTITEDTFITFTLQNRYLSGKVVDPDGNPVPDVSIYVSGGTAFNDFSGWFEAWTTSDSHGDFSITVFTSSAVSLRATPPPENPYGPIRLTVNVTEDTSVVVTLVQTVTFAGLLIDRDGNPIPNVNVYLYSAAISRSIYTDSQGLFSMRVSPDSYSLQLSGWCAPNVPQNFYLGKITALTITEDTFITFTLQNRYLSGKVDCEGKPVANVAIYVSGGTSFNDFSGWFEAWATTDSEGKFNVTVFTSSSVSLRATPPPESIYAPVSIANIDVTNDKTVLIALFYKAGVLPTANFAWIPGTPEVGQPITFDASSSIAGSGIIIRHKWSFGGGTYAIGKIVTHSYASPGVYTVTLNVTNSKGLWDIEQKQIQVVEPAGLKPPVASFTYSPKNPKVDQEVTFDASASFDPDGQIVSFNWDFGDVVYGIDVRDDINWAEVYNAGYRFAFVKATEGINWSKPGFEKRVEDAKKAELLVGVYHFGRPVPNKDKAKEEAESFVRLAGDYLQEGYLRPVLDVEDSDDYGEYPEQLGKETLAQWIKTWMDTVEDMTGVEPILYMNGYLFQFLSDSSIADQYDIWVPDLRDAEPLRDDSPNTRGWNIWAFWQYKLNVALAGGTADLDVFNGDISKLQTFVIGGEEANAKIVRHSYLKEGNYKATLTVIDDDGKASSTSKTVTVVKPKTDERIEKAIAWALDKLGPTEEYEYGCLSFVEDAYKYGAGVDPRKYIPIPEDVGFRYAKYVAEFLNAKVNTGVPPRGAYAFYDCSGTLNGYGYRNWGHVGLSLGNGDVIHAFGKNVLKNNYLDIQNLSPGGDWTNPQYIGWAYPPLMPPIKTKGLSVLVTCPLDLVVTDPDYLVISKEYNEIPNAVYIEEDFNGDGSPDDYVLISERKIGEYLITVIPEPGADPAITYTLEVSSEDTILLLAENVPISNIPAEPYALDSTTFLAHALTVTSTPITGIIFIINGVPKTTPYTEWLPEGSYTLEMPETHNGYVWSHWLEDGDTNRIKTITLSGTTWTGVFVPVPPPPPKPVGGYSVTIEDYAPTQSFAPYLALIAILTIGFATIKRKTTRKTK